MAKRLVVKVVFPEDPTASHKAITLQPGDTTEAVVEKINVKLRSIQLNIQQNKQTFVLSLIELAHGTDPNILVAGTSLENPEREPAFAWRFNRAWSPTISDVLQPATMNCN